MVVQKNKKENIHYKKSLKNINYLKKKKMKHTQVPLKQNKTPKIIEWYICKDREIKNTFRNNLIFKFGGSIAYFF